MIYFNLPYDPIKYKDEEFEIMVKEMLFYLKEGAHNVSYEINLVKNAYLKKKYGRFKEVEFSCMVEELTKLFFLATPIPNLLYKPERNFIKNIIETLLKTKPQTYLNLYEGK